MAPSRIELPLPACRTECQWWATAVSAYSFAAGFVVGLWDVFPLWIAAVILLAVVLIIVFEMGRGR